MRVALATGWYRVGLVSVMAIFSLAACGAPRLMPSPSGTSGVSPTPSGATTSPPTATPIFTSGPIVAPVPDLSTMSTRSVLSTSPDGYWTAEALLAFFLGEMDYARVILRWESEDSYREWRPYEEWSESGLGDSFVSDFYWSPNGRYVYFTHRGSTHPCGYPFATNLRRVDLHDGTLVEIPLTGLELGDISISPDVSRMAYRTSEGVLLYEFENGISRMLSYTWPAGYDFTVGDYVWSPDGEELAFSLTYPLCHVPEPLRTTTRIINLDSGTVRTPTNADDWLYLPDKVLADPIPTATLALHDFLESLYWGSRVAQGEYTYDRAAALYGGSYDTLIEMNPNIDPGDRAVLLRNACEVNGFQCLRLRDVISSIAVRGEGGARIVFFVVYLADRDDEIFALGACCGGEGGLPQIRFTFNVKELEDGAFRVVDLPPYIP